MKKLCGCCQSKEFRRLNRVGYLERQVLPSLGIYPWECSLCRRKIYLRTDGLKAPSSPRVAMFSPSLLLAGRKHR
jgi:hypothetical protein